MAAEGGLFSLRRTLLHTLILRSALLRASRRMRPGPWPHGSRRRAKSAAPHH